MSKENNAKLNSMPEEKRGAIKAFVDGTCDNISKMTREQKESMITICYQQLEPELREIDVNEFNCASYSEFLCQIVLAAATVDKEFSLEEEEAVDEVMKTVGLLGQPFEEDINKIEAIDLDLSKLSKKLKPTSRAMFLTFLSIIFLSDKELNDDEFDMMIDILEP